MDLVILPNGKTVTIDVDELQQALDNKEITTGDLGSVEQITI